MTNDVKYLKVFLLHIFLIFYHLRCIAHYSTNILVRLFRDLHDIQGSGCDTNLPSIEKCIQCENLFIIVFGMHF